MYKMTHKQSKSAASRCSDAADELREDIGNLNRRIDERIRDTSLDTGLRTAEIKVDGLITKVDNITAKVDNMRGSISSIRRNMRTTMSEFNKLLVRQEETMNRILSAIKRKNRLEFRSRPAKNQDGISR
jgi:uncharacterized coiled-coil DUF342 family protein